MSRNFITASSKVSWTFLWNMVLLRPGVRALGYVGKWLNPLMWFLCFRQINRNVAAYCNESTGKSDTKMSQLFCSLKQFSYINFDRRSTSWGSIGGNSEVHKLIPLGFLVRPHRVYFFATLHLEQLNSFAKSKWKVDIKYSCSTPSKILYILCRGRLKMAKQQII